MNLADVKKELIGDEKVLESAFKLETLYKKYKLIIWAVIVGLVIFFVARTVMQTMHESKLLEANNAFLALEKNPYDSALLAVLKEKNPALFELYSYAQANKNKDTKILADLTSSSNDVISDASTYTVAILDNKKNDSKLYKEMSILEDAYLTLKSGDVNSAKTKLDLIDERSQLFTLASLLKHSTIKAK